MQIEEPQYLTPVSLFRRKNKSRNEKQLYAHSNSNMGSHCLGLYHWGPKTPKVNKLFKSIDFSKDWQNLSYGTRRLLSCGSDPWPSLTVELHCEISEGLTMMKTKNPSNNDHIRNSDVPSWDRGLTVTTYNIHCLWVNYSTSMFLPEIWNLYPGLPLLFLFTPTKRETYNRNGTWLSKEECNSDRERDRRKEKLCYNKLKYVTLSQNI